METPYTGRAIINEFYNGVEIIVPAKKNWAHIIFFSFWLCGWLVGMILVPILSFGSANNGAPEGFMILWLCGWTFAGIFAFATWWWYVVGKEIITISQGVLTIVKKGSVAKTKSYDLNEAKNFRAYEDFADDFGFGRRRGLTAPWVVANEGTIKFDYGMETVRFGDKLYQAEGEYIIQKLKDKKLVS